jgi:CO/xanthine dehydrogenase FAD-binding subunit
MIPQSFEYLRPESVREAISLLQQHGDGAKILSGGQSLIPMMKMRLARPEKRMSAATRRIAARARFFSRASR